MAKINKVKLFLMLRKNIKLSEKRSVAYQQNKTAKIIIYLMSGFAICYMLFLSVMLALIANETDTYTASEFFFGLLPFFLVADFSSWLEQCLLGGHLALYPLWWEAILWEVVVLGLLYCQRR